jgi:ankyrin repeat protein
MTGDVEWIKMLLRQFGNIIDRSLKNNAGKTALDIAKERNYGDIVSLLSPQ